MIGVFIEFLEHKGHIDDMGQYPADRVAQGLQDLLICVEMFVAAIAFFYAFPLNGERVSILELIYVYIDTLYIP